MVCSAKVRPAGRPMTILEGALNRIGVFAAVVAAVALSACGGGGGTSGGGGGALPPTPTSAPTAIPTAAPVTGQVADFASGAALSGATVVVGSVPNPATCNGAQTQTLNVCGTPGGTLYQATTSGSGSFSLTVPASGTYMLTVSNGSGYATLHEQSDARRRAKPGHTQDHGAHGGRAELARLREPAARHRLLPTSFGNLGVDEYAEEQTRLSGEGSRRLEYIRSPIPARMTTISPRVPRRRTRCIQVPGEQRISASRNPSATSLRARLAGCRGKQTALTTTGRRALSP